MQTAAFYLAIIAAVLGGAFTAFVAYLAGQYGLGIWGVLGLISIASSAGAVCVRKAPWTATAFLIAAACGWLWLGWMFEAPINPVTASLALVNVIAGFLTGWAKLRPVVAR